MAYIKKEVRLRVWKKYDCHCAYCGQILQYKEMQVDHIKALYRNDDVKTLEVWGVERGEHKEENFNPSCARCNRWKGTFDLEVFRSEISKQVNRLNRDSSGFRMALDYGLIKETKNSVKFYFERVEE